MARGLLMVTYVSISPYHETEDEILSEASQGGIPDKNIIPRREEKKGRKKKKPHRIIAQISAFIHK